MTDITSTWVNYILLKRLKFTFEATRNQEIFPDGNKDRSKTLLSHFSNESTIVIDSEILGNSAENCLMVGKGLESFFLTKSTSIFSINFGQIGRRKILSQAFSHLLKIRVLKLENSLESWKKGLISF